MMLPAPQLRVSAHCCCRCCCCRWCCCSASIALVRVLALVRLLLVLTMPLAVGFVLLLLVVLLLASVWQWPLLASCLENEIEIEMLYAGVGASFLSLSSRLRNPLPCSALAVLL